MQIQHPFHSMGFSDGGIQVSLLAKHTLQSSQSLHSVSSHHSCLLLTAKHMNGGWGKAAGKFLRVLHNNHPHPSVSRKSVSKESITTKEKINLSFNGNIKSNWEFIFLSPDFNKLFSFSNTVIMLSDPYPNICCIIVFLVTCSKPNYWDIH